MIPIKTLSLAYVIRKYLFLSKGESSEEIWGGSSTSYYFICMYVCTYVLSLYIYFAKIVFACSTNTLLWHAEK